MKKLCFIIIALALLLSACAGPFTPGDESAPFSSDTSSPSHENEATQPAYYYRDWTGIEEPIYTEDDVIFTENGIIAGPFTFEYIDETFTFVDYSITNTRLNGLNLVSCETPLEELVIPSFVCNIPVVTIGYHGTGPKLKNPVFSNSPSLKVLYIPDAILFIDDAAFAGCEKLTNVRLSCSMQCMGAADSDYGEEMFEDTAVKFLDVPEGVSRLGYYTFRDSNLEYMILPSTLTWITLECMTRCTLRHIYLRAEEVHYPASLLEEIHEQTDATLYFYSETEPTEAGNFWHYVDGKPVIW